MNEAHGEGGLERSVSASAFGGMDLFAAAGMADGAFVVKLTTFTILRLCSIAQRCFNPYQHRSI